MPRRRIKIQPLADQPDQQGTGFAHRRHALLFALKQHGMGALTPRRRKGHQ